MADQTSAIKWDDEPQQAGDGITWDQPEQSADGIQWDTKPSEDHEPGFLARTFASVANAVPNPFSDEPTMGKQATRELGGIIEANKIQAGPLLAGASMRMAGELGDSAYANMAGKGLYVRPILAGTADPRALAAMQNAVDGSEQEAPTAGNRAFSEHMTVQPLAPAGPEQEQKLLPASSILPEYAAASSRQPEFHVDLLKDLAASGKKKADKARGALQEAMATANIPNDAGLERYGKLAATNIVPTVAGLAVGTATRNPSLGAGVASMFQVPNTYNETRESGHGRGASALSAGVTGATEFYSERLGFDAMLGKLASKLPVGKAKKVVSAIERSVAGRVATGATVEGGTESLSQAAQDAFSVYGLGEEMTWGEFAKDLVDSFGAGAILGGPLSAVTASVQGASEQASEPVVGKKPGVHATVDPESDVATRSQAVSDIISAAGEGEDVRNSDDMPDMPDMSGNQDKVPDSDITNPIDPSLGPDEKLAAIHKLTAENQPVVDDFLRSLDDELGTSSKSSVKKDANILAKASRPSIKAKKPWHDIEHVRDTLRFKTVLNSPKDLDAIASKIRDKGWSVVKVDTGKMLKPKEWGWRFAAVDLRMPNGQLVEYYMPMRHMEAAKKNGNHQLFEKWRSKDVSQLAPDELREYQRDLEKSHKAYDEAYAADLADSGVDASALRASLTSFDTTLGSDTRSKSSLSSSAETAPGDQTPESRTAPKPSSNTMTRDMSGVADTSAIDRSSDEIVPRSEPDQPISQREGDQNGQPEAASEQPETAAGADQQQTAGEGGGAGRDVPRADQGEAGSENATAFPVIEAPIADLTLSKDVPQFKKGADNKGVVEPLGGTFDRRGVGPIQIWRREDGQMEVISGRHRLDLARRSGEKTIPAQVYNEADGFSRNQAVTLDAELNIRDGQGSTADYVQYFKHNPSFEGPEGRQHAESRGLLARAKGRRAYAIASKGGSELIAAHRAGELSDEAAYQIAEAAPGDGRLQAVAMKQIQGGKTITNAVNTMRAVQTMAADRGQAASSGDMFGLDDSAMREAEQMAKIASAKQREIEQRLSAISGASKRPELAKREGVDIRDPKALERRIQELKAEKASWKNWHTDPEKIAQIRAELASDEPRMSVRSDESSGPALSRSEVHKIAVDVAGVDAVDRRFVITDWDGLPAKIRKEAANQGIQPGEVDGVHWNGKTYLVEGAIHSPQQVRELVFHEHYTHGGLRAKYGDQLGARLGGLLHKVGGLEGVRKLAGKQGIDLSAYEKGVLGNKSIPERHQRVIIMEELMAHMSKTTGTLRRTIEEYVGMVRDFLRRNHFPGLAEYGVTDLAAELRGAREAAMREDSRTTKGGPSFMRRPGAASGDLFGNRDEPVQRQRNDAPAVENADLFGGPTSADRLDAATRAKDAGRNGVDRVGRSDMMAGDGDLFAGRRPEQADLAGIPQDAKSGERAKAERAWRKQGTDSPYFKKWFGSSQIVDEGGKPRVVYHGTASDFSVFDKAKATDKEGRKRNMGWGKGKFYFASAGEAASSSAEFAEMTGRGKQPNVMPAFLKIERPIPSDDYLARVEKYMRSGKSRDQAISLTDAAIRSAGYDGIIDPISGGYAVFDPKQIKSASGNSGEFSSDTTDIRFSVRSDLSDSQAEALDKIGVSPKIEPLQVKLREYGDKIRKEAVQGIFDQFAPLKELDIIAYMQARMSKGTDGALEATFFHGAPKLTDGALDVEADGHGFRGVLATLEGEHDLFFAWIAGNRAEALSKEWVVKSNGKVVGRYADKAAANKAAIKMRGEQLRQGETVGGGDKAEITAEPAGRERLFTDHQIAELKKLNQGTMPSGQKRADVYGKANVQFRKYQNAVLEIAEEAGLIDPEQRKVWADQFYVPFYRELDSADGKSQAVHGSAALVRQRAFEQLKGSEKPLNDLFENVMSNWSHLLTSSMRNMAGDKALLAADGMGLAHEIGSPEKGSVWIMRGGKQVHYRVDDNMLLDALNSLNFTGIKGRAMDAMRVFKRALTAGVTASPTFRVRNLARDTMSALAVSDDAGYNPMKNIAQGWKGTGRNAETAIRLLAGGGKIHYGALLDGQQAANAKRLVKEKIAGADQILDTHEKIGNAFKDAWRWWKDVGDKAETINRAVLYENARKAGKSHLEASYEARDLLDFTMGGKWTSVRFLTSTVPFMNARMQGLYKLGKAAKHNPARFAAVTGVVALASALNYLLQRDDPDYKQLPDWVRDTYWPVKLGDKMLFIPKPFEIGAMGSIVERVTELAVGGDDYKARDFGHTLANIIGDQLSMNPIPQAVKPLAEAMANYDLFRQRNIDNLGDLRLSPEYRTSPTTSAGAIVVGRAINVSPKRVEHMVRGYLGWVGQQALNVSDLLARSAMDLPSNPRRDASKVDNMFGVGDFVKNTKGEYSKYVDRLYELQDRVNRVYADLNHARKTGDLEGAQDIRTEHAQELRYRPVVKGGAKDLATLRRRIKQVGNDRNLSAHEKRVKIDELRQRQNDIARRTDQRVRELESRD